MSAVTFVSGHRGLVGSAIMRAGIDRQCDLQTVARQELDLRDIPAVERWFDEVRPSRVIHAAGTVGGIQQNMNYPVDFLYDNSLLHLSVLHAAWKTKVEKLLYLGSSCVYPRNCPQPIREEYLLTGPLESTNDAYAIAKISGLLSCQAYRRQHGCNFISAMPTNLYGPKDNFDLNSSHVLPALMRKFHDAKLAGDAVVVVWGSGKPRREFLHVDDLASACWFLMEHYNDPAPINVGTGVDVTIAELADAIRMVVYPEAKIIYDSSMPDGTPQKLLDVSKLTSLGWRHAIDLHHGVAETYRWYCANRSSRD